MRIVIDTNVLVSALLFGGLPEEVFHRCVRGEPRLVTSEVLLTELGSVLGRARFGLPGEVVRAMVDEVTSIAERVEVTTEVRAIPEDPTDNAVLACAVDGEADHIVSGDRHLLDLAVHQGIPILTARQYLEAVLGAM